MPQQTPRAQLEKYLRGSPRKIAVSLISETVRRANALRKPTIYAIQCTKGTFRALDSYRVALVPSHIFVHDSGTYHPERAPRQSGDREHSLILRTQSFDHFDLCVPEIDDPQYLEKLTAWCDWIKERCIAAVERKRGRPRVRYIVFGELSFPSFWPVVIIGGSYHDPATFENLACIYFPDANATVHHSKLTAAQTVGEHIKVARDVTYPIYNIGEARFAVLICSDAFDLNIFFEQICRSSNRIETIPEIYFVPSWHLQKNDLQEDHRMLAACRQLSLATGKVVVFVNQGSDPSCTAAFIAGLPQKLEQHGAMAFLDLRVGHIKTEAAKTDHVRAGLEDMLRRSGRRPRRFSSTP